MKRTAITIGINYAGTPHELDGCVNDANYWADLLRRYSFSVGTLLEGQAKRATILSAISTIVGSTGPGDVAVITFAGHGTWVPDKDGDEPDGRDEALVPADVTDDGGNLILDDELHVLFSRIAVGATVVFISDCCHSGSNFRFAAFGPGQPRPKRKVRFLPPSHFIKSDDLYRRMERSFGQPAPRSDAPLPGLVHFSGCQDREYSNDTFFPGGPQGVFSYFARPIFEKALQEGGSYMDVWNAIREILPNWEYQQTPLLNATPALKGKRVFM